MRSAILAVLLLFALGCGGESKRERHQSDEPARDTQGGRRVEARFIESADGIGVFRHFYDTELEVGCNFEPVGSDAWRCLPEGPRILEIVYTDAECTEPHAPLLRTSHGLEGCTPPRYAVVGGSCGRAPSVFEIGSPSSADGWYRIVDGACTVSTSGTDYLITPYAVTPIALEEFQVGRLVPGDETEGVVPVDLRSDDGAGVRVGFRDALEGFDCRVGAPDERCYPTDSGLMGYLFADADCTQPAAMPLYCTERTQLPFAQTPSPDGAVYHRGGSRLSSSYSGSPELCEPSMNGVAFEVGPEIPMTRFAAGQRATVVGGDLEVTVESVGTASLLAQSLQSTSHGGYLCHDARGSDGELRCLPPPETSLDFFADAACTERVEAAQGEVFAVAVPSVCPPEVRVYARGDRHTGPVYAVTEGACVLAHDRPPSDSERWPHYVFPSEVPPTEFTRLFEVVR